MKSILGILTISLLAVSCGKEEDDSGKKSSLRRLSDQGITIQRSSANTQNSSFGGGVEEIIIRCVDNGKNGVTNRTRNEQLQRIIQSARSNSTIKLDGRKFLSYSVLPILEYASQTLQQAGMYNSGPGMQGFAHTGYNTNYEPCPQYTAYGPGILVKANANIAR